MHVPLDPLVHDTFPTHLYELAMDFGRTNVFGLKIRITEHTSQSAGISDGQGSL
jgi:hypothetical protein